MFESYFKLIEKPINKQIRILTRKNKRQEKIIENLLMEQNKVLSQLKIENRNIKLENKSLIKERDILKRKYTNLKNNHNKIKIKNRTPVPKLTRKDVFKRDNYLCLSCGTDEDLTLDHIVPRSKGGSNKINNLQILCWNCNLAKGDNIVDYRKNKVESIIKKKKIEL